MPAGRLHTLIRRILDPNVTERLPLHNTCDGFPRERAGSKQRARGDSIALVSQTFDRGSGSGCVIHTSAIARLGGRQKVQMRLNSGKAVLFGGSRGVVIRTNKPA
ncbi:hypothetical protein TRIHO_01890 [Tritonibacter horizontis]|uniref:Uncharacterized protein n=1 Tax=Tritonibacter horizontis TaxID=1768241 RepID=A0A132C2H3_9RHOB|nr:hypothetical protein TRIHO_01890 [Tritonibacter horizontis]